MSNGPLPSQLCLLSDLRLKKKGDKVRFLGCVMSYSPESGVLTLMHEHPQTSRDSARVDVRLLLELLTAEKVQVGEWVNVIGAVTAIRPSKLEGAASGGSAVKDVHVQAIMLWSAGPLNIQNYERRLDSWGKQRKGA